MKKITNLVLVILAALIPSILGQAVRSVTDLFVVDTDTNIDGGCHYVGLDKLNKMVEDADFMADAAFNAGAQYDNIDWVARLYEAFFNQGGNTQLTDDQRTTVRNRFRSVYRWLRSGGNINGGSVSTKPRLFCDSNFLIRKSMDDFAVEADGVKIVKDNNGNNRRIRDMSRYRAQQRRTAKDINKPLAEVVPYWNSLTNSYEFDFNHGGGVNDGPCTSSARVGGFTVPSDPFPYIVLCPRTFGLTQATKPNEPDKWTYIPRTLDAGDRPTGSAVTTVSEVDNGARDNVRRLGSIRPTAATFLHELFHLVLGGSRSYPNGGEVYKTDRILRLEFSRASVNPESYTKMAFALSNTLTSDQDNVNLFWHTGYATRD